MSTSVFFFGGWKANSDNMKVWLDSARGQKSKVDFNAFPYPDAGPDGDDAVANFKQLKSVVDAIAKSKADLIYIVGHSSGCAIANAVDDKLKDHKKVALVTLDGFVPDKDQRGRDSTKLWSAQCKNNDKLTALHFATLSSVAGANLQVYKPTDCNEKTTIWSLHYSLVNKSASSIEIKNAEDGGYRKCDANLMWLTKEA
jgi:hypothetical protein